MLSKRITTKHASWSNIAVLPVAKTNALLCASPSVFLPDSVFCKHAINSPQLRLYCCYMRVRRTANVNTNFLLRQNVGLGKGYWKNNKVSPSVISVVTSASCVLRPWRIKIPKEAKSFVVCIPEDAKIDWSIWRCFCRISCLCDFCGCTCAVAVVKRRLFRLVFVVLYNRRSMFLFQ